MSVMVIVDPGGGGGEEGMRCSGGRGWAGWPSRDCGVHGRSC